MKKKLLSLFLTALVLFALPAYAADDAQKKDTKDMTYEEYVANLPESTHVFLNRPIDPIPQELYEVDSRGGKLVEQPNFDLSSSDCKFDIRGLGLEYNKVAGKGYHRLTVADERLAKWCYGDKFEIKPNRTYMCSVLVWTDFSRAHEGNVREASVGFYFTDENGYAAVNRRYGLPDYTDGWTRIEFTMSAGPLEHAKYCQPNLVLAGFYNDAPASNILFADIKIYELPEQPLVPYKEGEGVTFRGSAGALDMKIEGATETGDAITVDTSGARYTFDLLNDTVTAEQKINMERKVSTWKSDISFEGLSIKTKNEKEVVITNPEISFGVQMDGNLFLTPHNKDVNLLCTSEIGGQWNRYGSGFLLSFDDYGGFSVAPDIPEGTGSFCRTKVITEDLDFTKLYMDNQISVANAERNLHISSEKPGWQIEWTIAPGERLCIGTFPPREYDWEKVFNSLYRNVFPATTHRDRMPEYKEELQLDIAQLWSFHLMRGGMQWGPYYLHNNKEAITNAMVKAAHDNDMLALEYTTSHFYYDRSSPDQYVREVKRLRDTYGIDGVYTDGTPGEAAWIVAYEEARMVRELFPDGTLIAHQTGQPGNGGAPLSSTAFFLPNLDTYYTLTLKGEGVPLMGLDAPLPYMTWVQYGLANCGGFPKADKWQYVDKNGETRKISLTHSALISLIHGGTARMDDGEENWKNIFLPIHNQLEENWKQYGNEENYFEKYYAPLARKLSHEYLADLGPVTVINESFEDEEKPFEYEALNVITEKIARDEGSALKIRGTRTKEKGSIFKRNMSLSGEFSVSFDIKIDEAGDYEYSLFNDYGAEGITLQFSADDKLKLKTAAGGYSVIGVFARNKWHNVTLEVNTDTHTVNIIADGVKMVSDMNINDELFYVSNHEFTTGGYGSAFCLDNFKVDFSY